MSRYANFKGFSLIELMIVIAIIGILSSVAIPSYQRYVLKAKLVNFMTMAEAGKLPISEYVSLSGDSNCASMQGTDVTPPANTDITHMYYGGWPTSCVTYASTDDFNNTGNFFALGFQTTDGESWSCVYSYTGTLSDVSDIVPNGCYFQS